MDRPIVAELATYCRITAPTGEQDAELQQCLDMAIEYVEGQIGALVDVVKDATCREAVFIIAKHEFGIRQNPTVRGGQMMGAPEGMPSPTGYMIPNRAATLINSLRFYNPDSIGIG